MGKRSFFLKYILLSFLALAALFIVLLPKPGIAQAAVNVATPSNAEYESTIVTVEEGYFSPEETNILSSYPAGSTPGDWALPDAVMCASSSTGRLIDYFPVTWTLPDVNELSPGLITIHGKVGLTDGYAFAGEGDDTVTYHLCWNLEGIGDSYTGDTITIDYAEVNGGNAIYLAFDRGVNPDEIKAELSHYRADLTLEDTYSSAADIAWDLSMVDPTKTGAYTITGSLNLPAVFRLAEGVVDPFYGYPPTAHIIVSQPGAVDLTNPVVHGSDNIRALWSWQMDLATAQLQYAVNEGEWQTPPVVDEEDGGLRYRLDKDENDYHPLIGWLYSDELYLYLPDLAEIAGEAGARFYFRVCYGEGSISDVLMVEIPANWDNTAETLEIDWGGDRDMIGRDGDDTGDLEQPAPSSPDEPAASAESTDPGSSEPIDPLYPVDEPEPDEPAAPEGSTDPGFSGPVEPDRPAAGPEPNEPDTPVRSADGKADKASSARPSKPEETPYPAPDGLEGQEEPADTPDEQPQVEAEPPMERVTDTQTTIGGERLRQLIEVNPESVLFEKQGIAVSIPTGFLRELELAAYELLTVSIEPLPAGFALALSRNGQELSDLPETFVRFPAASLSAGEEYLLQRAGDAAQIPAELDGAAGLLCAYITRTGQYTFVKTGPAYPQGEALSVEVLSFTPDAPEPAFSAPALALGAGALCVVSALGIWIWRGRRGR